MVGFVPGGLRLLLCAAAIAASLCGAETDAAPWRKLTLEAPPLPAGSTESHPVDKIVAAYRGGTLPAALVSDALFARRAYLDIWGLLPTPEQTHEFTASKDPAKHAALVDKLLSHTANYTNHWITFWNDHLRNDEGVVYHGDRKSITPWLKQALETNKPYDRFVQELLNPEAKTGPEGFLIGVNWRGDINASQTPVMQAAQNTAQIFLGVNFKCNSCHDSFISRWKLKDAYGLASFFSETPLEIHRCDAPTGLSSEVKFPYPELGAPPASASLAEKRAAAARLFTTRENGRTPRTLVNRYWKVLFGRGIIEPVDDMDARPWSAELLDWLAADFAANGYEMKHLLRRVMTSKTYRMASVKEAGAAGKDFVFAGPLPRRLSGEQFIEAVSSITGEWRALEPRTPGTASYARDWQLKSTPLGRSLGRPIRDQVTTERITAPTTLQALELVNGGTLAGLLQRGSLRMLGQLPPAAAPLFDSGLVGAATKPVPVDVELNGRTRLWLVVKDVDSYDPDRTRAFWFGSSLHNGTDLRAPVPSVTEIAVPAGGAPARFQATVGVSEDSKASDINPRIRFFVYAAQPDSGQMIPVAGEPPVARAPAGLRGAKLVERIYEHAFARKPLAAEKKAALEFGVDTAAGLEDFLWAVALSPEFQYVR